METALDSVLFIERHLDPDNAISALKYILIELHIPPKSKGYRCLLLVIPLYRADPDQSLTKEIYPAVAKSLGLRSWKRVEKRIRDAISAAWKRREPGVWERYFRGCEKPTNGEFISAVSELLDLWESGVCENRKDKNETIE